MASKNLKDLRKSDLKGKKVFVRVDLDVPLDNKSNIPDDSKIRAIIPTIKYLMKKGAKIILASHLGRPSYMGKYSLKLLAPKLTELLVTQVITADECIGQEAENKISTLQDGAVLLLENLRFHAEEEKNDLEFAVKLASLADLYISEIYCTGLNPHASVEGIAKLKPVIDGFLMHPDYREKNLSKVRCMPREKKVAAFTNTTTPTLCGSYDVTFHHSYLQLKLGNQKLRIAYCSISRLFLLKLSDEHTLVVVTLEPPFTWKVEYCQHLVFQFETDRKIKINLDSEDKFVREKKGLLNSSYKGCIQEVFIRILRGLSGAKITRFSTFRDCNEGQSLKSSVQDKNGVLYPLENGLFFLPIPPVLILYTEIDYIVFEWPHMGVGSSFDLTIRLKNHQKHVFKNIEAPEFVNLKKFLCGKKLLIKEGNEEAGDPFDNQDGEGWNLPTESFEDKLDVEVEEEQLTINEDNEEAGGPLENVDDEEGIVKKKPRKEGST